jgi:hypothetical protein
MNVNQILREFSDGFFLATGQLPTEGLLTPHAETLLSLSYINFLNIPR